ncbi:DUF4260 domain-containing protein [Cupriavidus pampae]|uniref:DUF4260 family protein n=1 Tax=Cupriavidus pampae TaxID=659251 RepID=A0ABN7Z214_9BURK|nr:DUF4260 domain-containing protein [Cupriavidus pampae]CAG9179852.1 hypothetical protein LMG32289_04428 [Cupriavidus pampae]
MTTAVSGGVRVLLRLEGLAILAASLLAYAKFGVGWGTFGLLFFVPDLSFLGYLAGPGVGAIVYNLAHSLLGPLAVLTAGITLSMPAAIVGGIIWTAHIGFDRALGYGLKYSAGFGFTHLGAIGRHAAAGQPRGRGAAEHDGSA